MITRKDRRPRMAGDGPTATHRNTTRDGGRIAAKWRRVALAFAFLAGALSSNVPRVLAQDACTAQADVDVHLCDDDTDLNPAFTPTCNSMDIQNGDTVTLTVALRNDSDFNRGAGDPDPPSAILQVGQTMTVHYACSASACIVPGQLLPGWFTFSSVEYISTGLSFADDGNGATGTITIIAPGLAFPRGDSSPVKLLRIRLTANEPPGTGVVYSRAEGSPTIMRVTDDVVVPAPGYYCIAGLTGTGEGTTAGRFGADDEPLDVCQHPNKQVITVDWRSTELEHSNSRVGFVLPGYDPATATVSFGYETASGPVYTYPPIGGFQQVSPMCWRYPAPGQAATTPGIRSARLCEIAPDKWCLDVKGYADFNASLPSDRVMWMSVTTGGSTFVGPKMPDYLADATWLTVPPGFSPPQQANQWYLPQTAWQK